MEVTARTPHKELLTFTALVLTVPVRYDNEDIPANFPGRSGKTLTLTLDLNTRKIRDWPADFGAYNVRSMKVCDEGVYQLLGEGTTLAKFDGYVPKLLPGRHYGDYIMLDIAADGTVRDWSPTEEAVQQFLEVAEEQAERRAHRRGMDRF